jgi:hypothetical protein
MSPCLSVVPCHFNVSSISSMGISCLDTASGAFSPFVSSYHLHESSQLLHVLVVPYFLYVPNPIAQHASAHNSASFTPVVCSISVRMRCFFVSQAIVILLTGLVGKVLQAVPLRAGLRVDVHFIVHGCPVCEVGKVDFLLVELLAAEAGELHVVQRPVELHVLARADLFGGGLDNSGGEEVDGYRC